MSDQEEVRSRKVGWPTIVLVGLAIFGAISVVQLVIGLVFSITRILVLVGIVAVLVLFLRGPPDNEP